MAVAILARDVEWKSLSYVKSFLRKDELKQWDEIPGMRRSLVGKGAERAVDAKLQRLFPGRFTPRPKIPGRQQYADWLDESTGIYIDLTSKAGVAAHKLRYQPVVDLKGLSVSVVAYRTWRWKI